MSAGGFVALGATIGRNGIMGIMLLRDDLSTEVRLPHVPTAVVSLVPSLTETVEDAAPGRLVGATDYCVHPPSLAVARVGGSKYPRTADVVALRPDLVLANTEENRAEDVAALREAGVPVWVTRAPVDVPDALGVLGRLLREVFQVDPPWLAEAAARWRDVPPVRARAVVPVWRRPWVVLGRDTFAGDVLRRLGVANAFGDDPQRYPRPSLDELRAALAGGSADAVVLPDEPYAFTPDDGPEAFPAARCAFVSGRHLTWWGPSLVAAHAELSAALGILDRRG